MFRTGNPKHSFGRLFITIGLMAAMLGLAPLYQLYEGFKSREQQKPEPEVQIVERKPLPGHWLRTGQGPEESQITKREISNNPTGESRQYSEAVKAEDIIEEELASEGPRGANRHLNKKLQATNVMYIWTDQGQLKVVSIMTLNTANKKPAVVVIPLRTIVNEGQTVTEVFTTEGKDRLRALLEEKLEVELHNYVHVDQEALYGLSKILGTLTVNDEQVTMAQALEESAAGIRTNDEGIVRAVAKQAIRPSTLLQIPALVKIFTNYINSDFSVQEMLQILNYTRELRVEDTDKIVLPGKEVYYGGQYCRVVSKDTWQNILYEATQ